MTSKENLLNLVSKALADNALLLSGHLGDRSKYLGLSDIAKYAECPRLAVLSKGNKNRTLQKQLILQRGHWIEAGVTKALTKQKLNILEQLEISIIHKNVPIKAHLDLVLVTEQACRILEIKSSEKIPENLYCSYEYQVYGQIGLLKRHWFEAVFSYGKIKNVSFPELCKQIFKLDVSGAYDDLQAWVLYLTMSEVQVFGAYEFSQVMLDICLGNAVDMWDKMHEPQELVYAKGLYLLCTSCDFNFDCPKFAGLEHPEWSEELNNLATLKAEKVSIEEQITELEEQIKIAYKFAEANGDWVNTQDYRFRVSEQAGRKSIDKSRLTEELEKIQATEILELCEKEASGFARLYVSKINNNINQHYKEASHGLLL